MKWEANDFTKELKYTTGSMSINFKKIPRSSELEQLPSKADDPQLERIEEPH